MLGSSSQIVQTMYAQDSAHLKKSLESAIPDKRIRIKSSNNEKTDIPLFLGKKPSKISKMCTFTH